MGNSKLDQYLRIYNAGSVIIREGDVGETVFLIKSGKVDVLKGKGAEQRKITTLSSGEIIGEMALREGEHERTATVKAITEVEGWRFPGPAFTSLVEQEKTFRQKLIQSLVDRLISTTKRLTNQENSELLEMNQLLVDSAHILLSATNSRQLEENSEPQVTNVKHSDEYLVARYDIAPDLLDTFQSLRNQNSIDDLSDQERIQISEFAREIVRDNTDEFSVKYSRSSTNCNEELAQALRSAKEYLNELEDHSQSFANKELQSIMEDRKDYMELLEELKNEGRTDYSVELLEKLLGSIKQEINIRYE